MLRLSIPHTEEVSCKICNLKSKKISRALSVCVECIRNSSESSLISAKKTHFISRSRFKLPPYPPTDEKGVECKICSNTCKIPENDTGFCGLRINEMGKLKHLAGTPSKGILEWYYDPLPTNCVADWVCPGGTGCGYPKFSNSKAEPEYGYNNLAVFYGACTFDCLFCQNWHYRFLTRQLSPIMSAKELASKVKPNTSCICYFGGDPTPQITHSIKTSEIALKSNQDRILRICWETNGTMMPPFLKKIAELSMKSGGCIKVDLKAWDENLNIALCGASNEQTKKNIEFLSDFGRRRDEPPFLIISTLLLPGYVDVIEVKNIAKFIASLNEKIPYSLLGFYPHFEMEDMPITSRKEAIECKNAAKNEGLENVRIGNIHLLR